MLVRTENHLIPPPPPLITLFLTHSRIFRHTHTDTQRDAGRLHLTFRSTRFHRIAHALSDVHTRENILSSLLLSFFHLSLYRPFCEKRERSDPCLYPLLTRTLVTSVSLTLDLQNDQRGFRFISRLSIRHLIYSVYRAPRSAGGTLRLSHYGLSPDCEKKCAGSET